MKRKLRWMLLIAGGAALALGLLVVGILVAARFHDGPFDGALAIVAAGPFESGELHTGPEPDWSFLRDHGTVEFQLLDPPRSRTTWIMEHDNRIFIVSGYMNTWYGKIWKHWPAEAEEDGRILLRVDGTLYPRRMQRVMEGDFVRPVLDELSRKYLGGAEVPMSEITTGNLWMFELLPRGAGQAVALRRAKGGAFVAPALLLGCASSAGSTRTRRSARGENRA